MIVIRRPRRGLRPEEIVTVRTYPFTIGRGVRNDWVIPSSGVSRAHIAIEREGSRFFIRDLDSRNGMRVDGTLASRFEITDLHEIELGDDHFEVILEADEDQTVDIPISRFKRERLIDQGLQLGAGLLLMASAFSISFWQSFAFDPKWSSWFEQVFGAIIVVLGAAFLTSVFSRVLNGRFRFLTFSSEYAIAMGVFVFVGLIGEIFLFNIGPGGIRKTLELSIVFCFAVWFVFRVLSILYPHIQSKHLFVGVCGGVLGLFLLTFGTQKVIEQDSVGFNFEGYVAYPLASRPLLISSPEDLSKSIDDSVEITEERRNELREERELPPL